MKQMKPGALNSYDDERKALTHKQIFEILDQGRQWNIAKTLKEGGSAFFPHTYLKNCGPQIAAVVHGCLDSGSNQVLALGVLHTLTDSLHLSRFLEMNRRDISSETSWGIWGPHNPHNNSWYHEFSLQSFMFLWDWEVKRRGISPPKLIIRYPFLVNRKPERLPGIRELKAIALDSVVVATGDLCHHGVAYGDLKCQTHEIADQGFQFAKAHINAGLKLLSEGNYEAYYDHCIKTKNDSIDVGSVLRFILGQFDSKILDLKLVDVSKLFEEDPHPSWVATALVELIKNQCHRD